MRRFILVLWLAAQASAGAAPSELTKRQTLAAKRLYDTRCAKCHRMYEPRDYSEDEWQLWMGKMRKKAKLNTRQEKLLDRYVDILRAQPQTSRTGLTSAKTAGLRQQASHNEH